MSFRKNSLIKHVGLSHQVLLSLPNTHYKSHPGPTSVARTLAGCAGVFHTWSCFRPT